MCWVLAAIAGMATLQYLGEGTTSSELGDRTKTATAWDDLSQVWLRGDGDA